MGGRVGSVTLEAKRGSHDGWMRLFSVDEARGIGALFD